MRYGSDSEICLQDFTDIWAFTEDCALTRWCRGQGKIPLSEALLLFYELLKKSPEHARWVRYHLAWLFADDVKLELVKLTCINGVQAYHLFMEDETLSEEEEYLLMQSFLVDNPVTDYMATSEITKRSKVIKKQFNIGSELTVAAIERGVLNVSDSV